MKEAAKVGFSFASAFLPSKACTDRDQRKGRGHDGKIIDGFAYNARERQVDKGCDESQDNADDDRILQNIDKCLADIGGGVCAGVSAFKGQNDHGENIVQRHRADDHKRCHAGAAVNILDKGNAENGGAAAVRTLHEGTDRMLVLQSKLRNDPYRQDRKKSGNKAESDIFHIKMMPDICASQIQKNKTWQADLEDKTVCD